MTEVYNPPATAKDIMEKLITSVGGVDKLKELPQDNLKAIALKIQDVVRLQRQSPITFYKPYESRLRAGFKPQEAFHKNKAKIRLFIGGNRSGKSEGGIVEDIWWATGMHPFRQVPIPNHGWVVSLDFKTSKDVAEEKVRKLLPSMMIQKWDNDGRTIYLKNGSSIGFRSADQDIEKFGGTARHWIHFDEEPPGERGYRIYTECLMRTADYGGSIWFTLTPVSGMSWTYDSLYEKAKFDNHIFVVEVDSRENPYLDLKELEIITSQMTADEIDMRLKGRYIQFAGLVYKEFSPKNVVEPFEIPKHWPRFRGIDHGINHPTACVWVAVSPQEEFYVYDEYYESDKTIRENCEIIRQITGGDKIEWTAIDPATESRDPQTGFTNRNEYHKHGVRTKSLRTDKMAGINKIKQLLQDHPVTKRPRLYVFNTCQNLIKEFTRYRWKQYKGTQQGMKTEEPVKVLDDALDALRYCIMSNARYEIESDIDGYYEPEIWYKT